METKPTLKRAPGRKPSGKASVLARKVSSRVPAVVVIDLLSCEFENKLRAPQSGKDEGLEHFLTAKASLAGSDENTIVGLCSFEVSRNKEENAVVEAKANYVLVFSKEKLNEAYGGDAKLMLLDLVSTSAWQNFCSLFSLMNAQADLDLPRLPGSVECVFEESTFTPS
ncbi:hypothetical protein [Roseicella aerolata]|uniref:Uncharacterized protein n=1 Tax=Roseicella aerolata TaxID=2883479 RepID=A0A9X1LCN4_9PROT|nr:hypothetical protein [Roseicella aerolata]MCB4823807.1 hypothetical protein [Roseicella aerolata]